MGNKAEPLRNQTQVYVLPFLYGHDTMGMSDFSRPDGTFSDLIVPGVETPGYYRSPRWGYGWNPKRLNFCFSKIFEFPSKTATLAIHGLQVERCKLLVTNLKQKRFGFFGSDPRPTREK